MIQRVKFEKLDTVYTVRDGIQILARNANLEVSGNAVKDMDSGLLLFYIRDFVKGTSLSIGRLSPTTKIDSLGLTDMRNIREYTSSWTTVYIDIRDNKNVSTIQFTLWNHKRINDLYIKGNNLIIPGLFVEVRIPIGLVDLTELSHRYSIHRVNPSCEFYYK